MSRESYLTVHNVWRGRTDLQVIGGRVKGDFHARFFEGLRVKLPRSTRYPVRTHHHYTRFYSRDPFGTFAIHLLQSFWKRFVEWR